MNEYYFFFRRHWFNPYRMGTVRKVRILADNLETAIELALQTKLRYVNYEVSDKVLVNRVLVNISDNDSLSHLLANLDDDNYWLFRLAGIQL